MILIVLIILILVLAGGGGYWGYGHYGYGGGAGIGIGTTSDPASPVFPATCHVDHADSDIALECYRLRRSFSSRRLTCLVPLCHWTVKCARLLSRKL
jgi:hypothetical protein